MGTGKRISDWFGQQPNLAADDPTTPAGDARRLLESEHRFRSLFEHNPDAVFSMDEEGRFLEVNPACERISGYSKSDLVGHSFEEIVVPEQHEHARAIFAAALAGNPQEWEFTITHRDGRLVELDGATLPIVLDGVVTGIFGIARDITSERQAADALQMSQARYRFVVETVSQVIFQTDAEGCFTFLNPAWAEITGFGIQSSIGEPFLAHVHPDDRELCMQMYEPVRLGEKTWCIYEARFLTVDGYTRWFEVQARALRDSEGESSGATGTLTDATDRKHLEAQLLHQAYHDALTSLPNRIMLMERLEQALLQTARSQDRMAMLFLDLDNFKVVNDSLGHGAGDQLIIAAANRVRNCLRATDTVARISGDEFAVLLAPVGEAADAAHAAQRIIDAFAEPFTLDTHEMAVAVSIGIAIGNADTTSVSDLLRQADMAMYRAKSNGRNRYEVFDVDMHAAAVVRLQLEYDLRQAIANDELIVHYQPKMLPSTGEIVGYESLMRWNHPTRGIIDPAEFIPVAEETGLIVPMSAWLLPQVCRQAMAWSTSPDGDGPLVSVNLSVRQFQQSDLVEMIVSVLRDTGLPPHRLGLEVTESLIMADAVSAAARLQSLRDIGVLIAIDDFGTGYSSLAYLKHLPVDVVKIDRAFIADLGMHDRAEAIVEAIIGLAHAIGLRVVAEGVETAAQFDLLRTMDCDLVQGFYCGRPAPP
jgi:diguanylate cyclase (GGDEF)-like protein/PAS domain S-box-containing protein